MDYKLGRRELAQSENTKALSAKRNPDNDLTADSRRFTQMDTERNPFKNITAEASLDDARDPEPVEGQRSQRINFLFVGRRRQTKTFLKLVL